jgi:hypothetical protein
VLVGTGLLVEHRPKPEEEEEGAVGGCVPPGFDAEAWDRELQQYGEFYRSYLRKGIPIPWQSVRACVRVHACVRVCHCHH